MKIFTLTLAAVLGAHTVATSEPAPPPDQKSEAIWLTIDYVEDQAKPGTYVTCVTCSVRPSNKEEPMELTGRAWIELTGPPVQGIAPRIFARREAIQSKDPKTGRTTFMGFFPGAHGPHSGHWPNLILEMRPKDAKDDTHHVRIGIFRQLTEDETLGKKALDPIDVPRELHGRVPPPRIHRRDTESGPWRREVRPLEPMQPVPTEPAPNAVPQPAPKEQEAPKAPEQKRRGTPPKPRGFATDNVA